MGNVVVIGSINTDLVFTSDKRPKAGETVLGNTFSVIPGGKGANQAVAAAKLGASTHMIGCVGNDANGEFSLRNLQKMNVGTIGVEVVENIPTGVANIIVSEMDNSIIVIPGANFELSKMLIDKNRELIKTAQIVLLQLEIPLDIVEYSIKVCKDNNVNVMLNPAPAQVLSPFLVENSTFITPNEHELKIIFGKEYDTEEILKKYPNKLIVTMGSKGAKYFNGSEIKTIPSFKVNVVDTTGAGDTFCGGLAAALVEGMNIEESIIFANKAASLAVTKLGAQSGMPALKDIQGAKTEYETLAKE